VLAWSARYRAAAVAHTGRGPIAARWAVRQLGKPYQWGAAGPASFDCSGLSLRAWQAAGIALPRLAAQQYDAGAHLPVVEAAPGDLVFYATDPSDPATIYHVGLALGDGRIVDAPFTGSVVHIVTLRGPGLVPLATRPE
jgi:cell wall-associated NlpC family hydrolase